MRIQSPVKAYQAHKDRVASKKNAREAAGGVDSDPSGEKLLKHLENADENSLIYVRTDSKGRYKVSDHESAKKYAAYRNIKLTLQGIAHRSFLGLGTDVGVAKAAKAVAELAQLTGLDVKHDVLSNTEKLRGHLRVLVSANKVLIATEALAKAKQALAGAEVVSAAALATFDRAEGSEKYRVGIANQKAQEALGRAKFAVAEAEAAKSLAEEALVAVEAIAEASKALAAEEGFASCANLVTAFDSATNYAKNVQAQADQAQANANNSLADTEEKLAHAKNVLADATSPANEGVSLPKLPGKLRSRLPGAVPRYIG